jgi:hypothetical protein
MLKGKYPLMGDQELYDKARLINAALIAKIHTVEWTPAILPHPITKLALNTNWRGIAGENIQDFLEFLDDSEILGGIVGSKYDHHAAPYSLTEEFVAVYRMHALMPDDYTFRSLDTGKDLGQYSLPDLTGRKARPVLETISMTDLFYSFGLMHPGVVRLNNFPKHLQLLRRENGEILDLAAVDILRDRERGVPRYNQFLRLLHKEPVKSFEELTGGDKALADRLRKVYNNDIEMVDTMVGLYAEPLPEGFGFSETAFRVFILMASRRLKSDRFFTDDWRPEIYTQEGLDWVRNSGMASVLRRHMPELAPAFEGLSNPFEPWRAVEPAQTKKAAGR